ncbi:glycosyltransferase, partial [Lysobacter sp. 2RAB21]
MRSAVLIPCYNEARTVAKVVADFRRALPQADIWVFDNASTDGTAELARQAGARVYRVPAKGKGNVVRAMFREVEADVYLMVDGDDTYPADHAGELLED